MVNNTGKALNKSVNLRIRIVARFHADSVISFFHTCAELILQTVCVNVNV